MKKEMPLRLIWNQALIIGARVETRKMNLFAIVRIKEPVKYLICLKSSEKELSNLQLPSDKKSVIL